MEKICNACIEDGTPLPEYEIIGNSIMIRFTAREDRVIRLSGDDPNHDANDANRDANDANLTQNERKVLSAVRDNGTLSATKLAEQLGISRASVQRTLKSLTEKGYLQRQGTTRGMWIVLKWQELCICIANYNNRRLLHTEKYLCRSFLSEWIRGEKNRS